ncbi:hypothetical protein [Azotobacter beijerinckii]|uniref:hypothetical protein n=1 Tax=Azotobacter beijerinckii TaxID=170623 RepID=UPI000B822DAE|nr:hypothetical protein [Azotobacter beijerinckii]
MGDHERANTITQVKNALFIENMKGLFLMNGGGAVALTTWFTAVWEKEWAKPMLCWQLWALACFGGGVFFAGAAFMSRFFAFYHSKTSNPCKNPWWWAHLTTNVLSILAFATAVGFIVKEILKKTSRFW